MKMKSNALVKLLVPLALLGTVLIGVKACSPSGEKTKTPTKAGNVLAELSPEDLKSMGIEVDTPQDTLRTLVGSLKTVTSRQNQLDADNKTLAEENKTLKQTNQNVDERINQALATSQSQANKEQGQLKGQVQELTSQVGSLLQRLKDNGDHGGSAGAGKIGRAS